MACGILVSWPMIKPVPPALEVWSLNHRTIRVVPWNCYFRKAGWRKYPWGGIIQWNQERKQLKELENSGQVDLLCFLSVSLQLSKLCYFFPIACDILGLPWWPNMGPDGLQHGSRRRHRFNPWVRKSPWRRTWHPTPVFLYGESHA